MAVLEEHAALRGALSKDILHCIGVTLIFFKGDGRVIL